MHQVLKLGLVLLGLGSGLGVWANSPSSNGCKEVNFTVTGAALNRDLSSLNLNNLTILTAQLKADAFPRVPVAGSQTLAGWYCPPRVVNGNNSKLQVLMSSITNNREAWTAQGGTGLYNPPLPPYKPEVYSWVDYAAKLGYATLAVDKLGTGLSSHPDPILVVQEPYEIQLYHDLAQQIKLGTTGPQGLPIPYTNLIYIGNSYGSQTGAALFNLFPLDFQAAVLTGFSNLVLPSLPGVTALGPEPASVVNPARYGNLPPGYVTSPVEQSRTNSFFGSPAFVDFEQVVADLFYQREDVVSIGQFASIYAIGIPPSPNYRGRVLLLDGEEDQAYCGPGSSAINPDPQCDPLLVETKSTFPNADYSYQNVSRSGHALLLHKSAQTTLRIAHQFLAGASFANNAVQ